MVVLKLPFDGIWPSLCRFKVTNIMFFLDKAAHIPQTSISYLLCLQRHHHRKNGKGWLGVWVGMVGWSRPAGRSRPAGAAFLVEKHDPRAFLVEQHGSARFSGRKTWIRALFRSKSMDPHDFQVEKHGSARFSGGKTWIRTNAGRKNMDPRAFREDKLCIATSIK